MRVDGKFLAVDGFPFFDGKFLAVDGNSNFDGKSPLYRDRPPVRYFHVGKFTEHLPGIFVGQSFIHIPSVYPYVYDMTCSNLGVGIQDVEWANS